MSRPIAGKGAVHQRAPQLADFSIIKLNGKVPIKKNWTRYCIEKSPLRLDQANGHNVGVCCGPASGCLVLDVDGLEKFKKACRENSWTVPETFTVETGSGKPHYYFLYPHDGATYGNKSLQRRGFDIRGVGGQVVAPGSIHPDTGKPYRVVKDIPMAPAPKWLLNLYDEQISAPPKSDPLFDFNGIDSLPIRKETKRLICNGAPVGQRSEAMMTVLNALAGAGLSDEGIFKVFDHHAIGEKYREKGSTRARWLQQQIVRARAYVARHADSNEAAQKKNRPRVKIYTAAELVKTDFPEPKWAVPGILPEGVGILGGKPKHGKSIMGANLGQSLSNGEPALGSIPTQQGSVLYLALEDVPRRLKDRIRQTGSNASENFHLTTEWPRMGKGGLRLLDQEISKHPDMRLVIVDTLKMFKPVKKNNNKQLYDEDYEPVSAIKGIADKHGICILIIHHLRKSSAEDIMDTFSGTLGLTGAADSLLALERITGQADAKLHVTGRDLEPNSYALKFDPVYLSWKLLGKSGEVKNTEQQQAVYDALKNNQGAILTPKDLQEITKVDYRNVNRILHKLQLSGEVRKEGHGKYQYICPNGPNGPNCPNGPNGPNPLFDFNDASIRTSLL